MDEIDREVLALRHFEHLTNAEAALALGISRRPPATATSAPWSGSSRSSRRSPAGGAAMTGRPDASTMAAPSDPSSGSRDPVEPLAEEFMARYRRGERPALAEYTDKYPELADRIRDVFPMLVVMEEADSGAASSGDATGTGPAGASGRDGGGRSGSPATASSARSAGAAWASSTRPSSSRWAGTSP